MGISYNYPPLATDPNHDYTAEMAMAQRRQRLAQLMLQNQQPATTPLGAIADAFRTYVGAKGDQSATQDVVNIGAQSKAADLTKLRSLATAMGIDPNKYSLGGIDPSSPYAPLALSMATAGNKRTVVGPGASMVDEQGNPVFTNPQSKTKDKPIKGYNGEWLTPNDQGGYDIQMDPNYKEKPAPMTPQEKTDAAIATDAGKRANKGKADQAAAAKSAAANETTVQEFADVLNDPAFHDAVGPIEGRTASVAANWGNSPSGRLALRLKNIVSANLIQQAGQLKGFLSKPKLELLKGTIPETTETPAVWYDWFNTVYLPTINGARTQAGLDPLQINVGTAQAGPMSELPKGVTEEQVQHTMRKYGHTREQVIQTLRGNMKLPGGASADY